MARPGAIYLESIIIIAINSKQNIK